MQGFLVVALVALVGAEIVNLQTGLTEGPAARSSALAAAGCGVAPLLSHSRWPAAFLLPVVGVLAGALLLGAGGQVEVVAIATAAMAALTLALVERDQRAYAGPMRTTAAILASLLLGVTVAAFAVFFHSELGGRAPASPLARTLTRHVAAPGFLHPLDSTSKAVSATPEAHSGGRKARASTSSAGTAIHRQPSHRAWLRWLLLMPVALVVGAAGFRWAYSAWRWRRVFRQILRNNPRAPAAAWIWTLAHLQRLGFKWPRSVSPDRVAAGHDVGMAAPMQDHMVLLAGTVAPALFSAGSSAEASDALAWRQAETAARAGWEFAGRRGRLMARLRLPATPFCGG
jgi:hypothetical protein